MKNDVAGLGFLVVLGASTVLTGCGEGVESYEMDVLRTLSHDTAAYTQGFVYHSGRLFESTGRYGESEVRELDPETGTPLRRVMVPEEYFGEGLALVDQRLIQLTWKAGVAIVYEVETLEQVGTFEYEGEGWGLCYDGQHLYMTDGTHRIYRRSPETFEVVGELAVTRNGFSVQDLNELECVGDYLWANVYMTDKIVRIDKESGAVVGELDAYALTLASDRPTDVGAVLNGIAYDPVSDTFYVTGKLWPKVFQIRAGI